MKQDSWWKITIVMAVAAVTLAIHYGLFDLVFGHSGWGHALHSRLCYVPIIMAASWFGLRGGFFTALAISVLALPYIFGGSGHVELSSELVEIFFYFGTGIVVGVLVDREGRIRQKHEQAQLQLERSQKFSLIGQMAAGVAHEIKNPLASIKGAFEILSDDGATATDKKEFQEIISKEIRRIDGTVKDFLDFARPRAFRPRPINLSHTLASSMKQLQNQIEDAGLALVNNIQQDIHVSADPETIHQVILNLVLNAIEASRPGGSLAVNLTADGTVAKLMVEDCGDGIEESELERVFEPFYTTKPQGTGLGLATVKSIVDRHNGTIAVESEVGKGTKFTIELKTIKER